MKKNTGNVKELTIVNESESKVKSVMLSFASNNKANALYLWEVETYTVLAYSPCEATGHTWGVWDVTDPVCSPDELIDGFQTRECQVCGEVETEVLTAEHDWSEWNLSGVQCEVGGTKTRTCKSCGKSETEEVTTESHVALEVQGAKEPTFEEEGSTGTTVCTACGVTVLAPKVISKLVNEALTATPSTNSTNWPIVGNGSNWAPNTIPNMNDGKLDTGASTNDWHQATLDFILTWDEAVEINKIVYVCNGTGNFGYDGDFENTNWAVDYIITVYDEDDNVITTATGNTKDQTQIEVEIPEDSAAVKKVVINIDHKNNGIRGGVFEIMAISGGKVQD